MLELNTAETVIDHGLSLGADFAEVFVERSLTSAVNTLSSQVQAVESGIDFGIGLRLVFGAKVLYGYTNKTAADELKRIMIELATNEIPGWDSLLLISRALRSVTPRREPYPLMPMLKVKWLISWRQTVLPEQRAT